MQKIIGAALIFVSAVCLGMGKGNELQQYVERLQQLRALFIMMQREICCTKDPFEDVFLHLGIRFGGWIEVWMRNLSEQMRDKTGTFQEIWNAVTVAQLKDGIIRKQDLVLLCDLGKQMGYLDEQMQLDAIQWYIKQLDMEIARRNQVLMNQKKVFRCLGWMGGILLIVIFL